MSEYGLRMSSLGLSILASAQAKSALTPARFLRQSATVSIRLKILLSATNDFVCCFSARWYESFRIFEQPSIAAIAIRLYRLRLRVVVCPEHFNPPPLGCMVSLLGADGLLPLPDWIQLIHQVTLVV